MSKKRGLQETLDLGGFTIRKGDPIEVTLPWAKGVWARRIFRGANEHGNIVFVEPVQPVGSQPHDFNGLFDSAQVRLADKLTMIVRKINAPPD